MPPQEVGQVDDACQQLGKPGGDCRAPDAQVQQEDGRIVQHAVGQAPDDDRQDGQLGIAVGLDEHLHVIGHDEAHGKGGEAPEVVDGVGQRHAPGAQQAGERLQKHEYQHGDGQADGHQQRQILGEQAVGLFALLLSEVDSDDGAAAHGEDDGDGEQHVGEGHRQIHGGHGIFAHALGHEQAVHDGVQREHHQRRHGGRNEMEKLGEQTALIEHFG